MYDDVKILNIPNKWLKRLRTMDNHFISDILSYLEIVYNINIIII